MGCCTVYRAFNQAPLLIQPPCCHLPSAERSPPFLNRRQPLTFYAPAHPDLFLQVREALAHKVSRERIGAELEGMMHGERDCSGGAQLSPGGFHPCTLFPQPPPAPPCPGPCPPRSLPPHPPSNASTSSHPLAGADPVMALRLLHRLRIFGAVFAVPPSVTMGLSEDAFGAAANRLAVSAYDEMQAWVRLLRYCSLHWLPQVAVVGGAGR